MPPQSRQNSSDQATEKMSVPASFIPAGGGFSGGGSGGAGIPWRRYERQSLLEGTPAAHSRQTGRTGQQRSFASNSCR